MDSLNPDILKNHIPNKHFAQEELDILKFLIVDKNMSPYEINKKYPNISPPLLYQREKESNWKVHDKRKRFSKDQLQEIQKMIEKDKISIAKISKKYGTTYKTIRKLITLYQWEFQDFHFQYHLNDNYF